MTVYCLAAWFWGLLKHKLADHFINYLQVAMQCT